MNYKRIDDVVSEHLRESALEVSEESLKNFREMLGFPVEQVAIIRKCNAVVVVVVYYQDLDLSFLEGRLLDTWDKLSSGGITNFLRDIKFYNNEEAIRYLGESSVGVHSVAVGDAQVYHQVYESLQLAYQLQKSNPVLLIIANWINSVLFEVKAKTSLLKGNTSLERIACDILSEVLDAKEKVGVVGLGMAGKLVVKILSEEKLLPVVVANRTFTTTQEIALKYNVEPVEFDDFARLNHVAGLVLAIDNNADTLEYYKKLKNSIDINNLKVFIDISLSSMVNQEDYKGVRVVNLNDLSGIADLNRKDRLAEVNKARQLIDKMLPLVIDKIKNEVSQIKIEERKQKNRVKLDTKKLKILEARSLGLRSVRNFFDGLGFFEVITPYIVGVSTDPPRVDKGGAIGVLWPGGGDAFLRQSNQIYKQIIVASGMKKIYEIGPFWRAETVKTYRHLQESIGVDIEYVSPNELKEVYEIAYSLILDIQKSLIGFSTCKLQLPELKSLPVLEYSQAVSILSESGYEISYGEDLGLIGEAKLGEIIKTKYDSDACVVLHYPDTIKKFYTKKSAGGLTETFDLILGGWELASGAIRETNREKIERSMMLSRVNPVEYNFYLSIIENANEHGGFGLGFDRLIAKVLGLGLVRDAVAFPRDFNRLVP